MKCCARKKNHYFTNMKVFHLKFKTREYLYWTKYLLYDCLHEVQEQAKLTDGDGGQELPFGYRQILTRGSVWVLRMEASCILTWVAQKYVKLQLNQSQTEDLCYLQIYFTKIIKKRN